MPLAAEVQALMQNLAAQPGKPLHEMTVQEARALSAAHVQAAMARLPARQRMALAMWAYADADVPAIARSLELDPNAAHQLLYRAKSALRNLLQEHVP